MKDMNRKNQSNLKTAVIETIEKERVCPRSRWFFLCKETIMWLFWALSVIVGAVAVAVSLFVLSHSQYALHEATHESYLAFLIGVLPYLWILLFIVMALLAMNNFRHTKRGYRYCVWRVVLSSMVLSLAGGAVLQLFGFGYALDYKLGQEVRFYMSQEKFERQLWQTPIEGRLIGRQVLHTVEPTTKVVFEDSSGVRWNLHVSELTPIELELLEAGHVVRIVGTSSDLATKQFHACGVFPWLLDKAVKRRELSAERQVFIERVYRHKNNVEQRLAGLEFETFDESNFERQERENMNDVCSQIASVRRLEAARY